MAGTLREEIGDRIRTSGPMPFESFMRLALYHPRHGYYATRVPGAGSDYHTSPALTPWFGRLVACEFQHMWEALGAPEAFTVVEVGPGRADLAAGALTAIAEAGGGLAGAVRWRFVERFQAMADLQRARLGPLAACAEWSAQLSGPQAQAGCVLAHEVLDNFPAHLLEKTAAGQLAEIHVAEEGGFLVARPGALSDERLAPVAADMEPQVPTGARFEVCCDLEGWCRDAADVLARGYLLVIDYGDKEPNLWRRHSTSKWGTIVTYGPDGFGEDPLAGPGTRDITAEVNFSAVERLAGRVGFIPDLFTTQRQWLRSLGFDEVAGGLTGQADAAWMAGRNREAMALEEELSGLQSLVAHLGLGDIMVLREAKDAPPLPPAVIEVP
ncbi:MAG TPA: SAM-dependent methyltransferase [Actinomycetota bacterium]|nr:SAM-dependent methyltransferase [Actinomycetota bacterium]